MKVEGKDIGGYRVLRAESAAVPNAIAAFLLYLRDRTGKLPHAYFHWGSGNPVAYLFDYVVFGRGDTAPVTREVLRQAEPDEESRPGNSCRWILSEGGRPSTGKRLKLALPQKVR